MESTPSLLSPNYEKNLLRGEALAELRKLKAAKALGNLNIALSELVLSNGTVIKCSSIYNIDTVDITLPDLEVPVLEDITIYGTRTKVILYADVICTVAPFYRSVYIPSTNASDYYIAYNPKEGMNSTYWWVWLQDIYDHTKTKTVVRIILTGTDTAVCEISVKVRYKNDVVTYDGYTADSVCKAHVKTHCTVVDSAVVQQRITLDTKTDNILFATLVASCFITEHRLLNTNTYLDATCFIAIACAQENTSVSYTEVVSDTIEFVNVITILELFDEGCCDVIELGLKFTTVVNMYSENVGDSTLGSLKIHTVLNPFVDCVSEIYEAYRNNFLVFLLADIVYEQLAIFKIKTHITLYDDLIAASKEILKLKEHINLLDGFVGTVHYTEKSKIVNTVLADVINETVVQYNNICAQMQLVDILYESLLLFSDNTVVQMYSDNVSDVLFTDTYILTLSWDTPVSIVYGTALSAVQLNAIASIPGEFTYDPVIGTVLHAGDHSLTVGFVPTNPLYETVYKEVILTVTKKLLTVTAVSFSSVYNTASRTFSYFIGGFVGTDTVTVITGSFAVTCNAVQNSNVGTYNIAVGVGTAVSSDYTFNFVAGVLTIIKAEQAPIDVFCFTTTPTLNSTLVVTIDGGSGTGNFVMYSANNSQLWNLGLTSVADVGQVAFFNFKALVNGTTMLYAYKQHDANYNPSAMFSIPIVISGTPVQPVGFTIGNSTQLTNGKLNFVGGSGSYTWSQGGTTTGLVLQSNAGLSNSTSISVIGWSGYNCYQTGAWIKIVDNADSSRYAIKYFRDWLPLISNLNPRIGECSSGGTAPPPDYTPPPAAYWHRYQPTNPGLMFPTTNCLVNGGMQGEVYSNCVLHVDTYWATLVDDGFIESTSTYNSGKQLILLHILTSWQSPVPGAPTHYNYSLADVNTLLGTNLTKFDLGYSFGDDELLISIGDVRALF